MKMGAPRLFKRRGAPILWKKEENEEFYTEKREKRQKKNCENY